MLLEAARDRPQEVRAPRALLVEVTFGDFPYVIRITPVRQEGS